MRPYHSLAVILLLVAFSATPGGAQTASRTDDAYLAGYAAAVLERDFRLGSGSLRVRDGVITIAAGDLREVERDKVVSALLGLPGVVDVRIVEDEAGELPRSSRDARARMGRAGTEVLPRSVLFEPLLADPRWPRFSVIYQRYLGDDELRNIGAPSFGISFGLVEDDAPLVGGRWQLGLQGGVFAVFDLDAESSDLINADYLAALPVSWRRGWVSTQLRVYHQSSHLGDEFLLRNRIDRINLSYEAIDGKLSIDLPAGFRLYGGGGYLLRREPSDIERASTQAGLELESPWSLGGMLRPIAGFDVQNRAESDWKADLSAKAGLQLENRSILSHEIQFLLEYFDGRSPNGQFYERDIEYVGFGVQLELG